MTAALQATARRARDESGDSPVTAMGAILMVLLFIFITAQATLHVFAASQASGVVLEGASRVARGTASCGEVEAWIDTTLSSWPDMHPACAVGGDTVTVRVRGSSPAPALRGFGLALNRATLDRSATMHVEQSP